MSLGTAYFSKIRASGTSCRTATRLLDGATSWPASASETPGLRPDPFRECPAQA
jgi:hypothetical protein